MRDQSSDIRDVTIMTITILPAEITKVNFLLGVAVECLFHKNLFLN